MVSRNELKNKAIKQGNNNNKTTRNEHRMTEHKTTDNIVKNSTFALNKPVTEKFDQNFPVNFAFNSCFIAQKLKPTK